MRQRSFIGANGDVWNVGGSHMLKPVIAATALLAIAGSTYVYAQQGFAGHDGDRFINDGRRVEFRHRPSPADVAAFTDARIAAMKAGLELTPDQAKNWPAFEQAVRDLAQLRIDRMKARQAEQDQQQPMSPFDRLARRADNMAKTGAALKKVADAGAPLYQSLDDAQKSRFVRLAHLLRPHMHSAWRRFGERDGDSYRGDKGWWHGERLGQDGVDNGDGSSRL
jgi:hypothetical protein